LAILLWPVQRPTSQSSFVAAGLVGEKAARVIWAVVWGCLAFFALLGANRSPDGLHDIFSGMAPGEPGWLSSVDIHVANVLADRGLVASILIAIVLAAVALRAVIPTTLARVSIVLGIVAALAIWVIGQNFGGILAGGATDPSSGPLLILLALAYWPLGARSRKVAAADKGHFVSRFAMEGV
jgi:hypothetical protein